MTLRLPTKPTMEVQCEDNALSLGFAVRVGNTIVPKWLANSK